MGVPVIKTTQSSAYPRPPVRILPAPAPSPTPTPSPITLIPVSRLQCIKKVDPSNNIEKTLIKTEPAEETETSTAQAFHSTILLIRPPSLERFPSQSPPP